MLSLTILTEPCIVSHLFVIKHLLKIPCIYEGERTVLSKLLQAQYLFERSNYIVIREADANVFAHVYNFTLIITKQLVQKDIHKLSLANAMIVCNVVFKLSILIPCKIFHSIFIASLSQDGVIRHTISDKIKHPLRQNQISQYFFVGKKGNFEKNFCGC